MLLARHDELYHIWLQRVHWPESTLILYLSSYSVPTGRPQEYLTTLEQNILGLANHLEQASRRKNTTERTGHWFRAISESEVTDTYLRTAAGDLARMCEVMEGHHADSDETLFIQNLQSIADYVRTAQVCGCKLVRSWGVREG